MTTEPFLETRIVDEDILAVLLHGSLDSSTVEEFDRAIQRHVDDGETKIIIDCRHLGFVSSMGIGRLVALQTRLKRHGGAVKLASIQGRVAGVIQLSGIGKILDIYGDLEFARQSFYE